MNLTVKNIVRFVLFFVLQVLVLNQIEIGTGAQIMIYPLFIFLLPVELNVIFLMAI